MGTSRLVCVKKLKPGRVHSWGLLNYASVFIDITDRKCLMYAEHGTLAGSGGWQGDERLHTRV